MDSMQIFLCMDVHFVGMVHMNFHAKSGVCSSKNERVMALGTKEDGHSTLSIVYIQAIIQSKLGVREFVSLDNIKLSKFVIIVFLVVFVVILIINISNIIGKVLDIPGLYVVP